MRLFCAFLSLFLAACIALNTEKNTGSASLPRPSPTADAKLPSTDISIYQPIAPPVATSNSQALPFPIEEMNNRITKKPFGILITPETSPVQPERFSGYHTGVDFEVGEGEETGEVDVFAICDGEVVFRDWVKGYGGVLVHRCTLEGRPVTVLYGHMRLGSITAGIGTTLEQGERIGVLGKGGTRETDGERKHLHLGVHRGEEIELRGYVETQEELKHWINPLPLLQ